MNGISFWQQKIYQFFHDPPAKPYIWYPGTGGHKTIAKEIFELFASAVKQKLKFTYLFPDWASSGADRPVVSLPRGKGFIQMHWHTEPIITHPLSSGFRLDVRLPGEEAKLAQNDIRKNLIEGEEEIAENLGKILKDWQDQAILQKTFLALWRRFREELVNRDLGPEFGDPLWEEMPSESRCPDHSIWDHLHITTALCFLTKKNLPEYQEPWLFRFSLGPVRQFIKESRTSRDLWTSSFILSDLIWHAMEPIVTHYGPDCIIYPDLRGNPRVDSWLKSNYQECLKPDSNPSTFAAVLPNSFTAVLPRGGENQDYFIPIEDMAAKAKKNVDKRWHELEEIVCQWFKNIARDESWREMWKRQHQDVLYTVWSAVAWKKPMTLNYKESLTGRALPVQKKDFRKPPDAIPEKMEEDQQSLLERNNRLAPWMPQDTWIRYEWAREVYGRTNLNYLQLERGFDYVATHHQLGVRHQLRKSTTPESLGLNEGGEKCTICGRRQALVGVTKESHESMGLDQSRQATKKFWADHKEFDPEGTGAERLCAVCTMKRFLVEAGNQSSTRTLTGINPIWAGLETPYEEVVGNDNKVRLPFPSTATIASQDFLIKIATNQSMEPYLEEVAASYEKTGIPSTNFLNALPRLAGLERKVSKQVKQFLQIDPQYSLFPEAVQGKISLLGKDDPKKDSLNELAKSVQKMRTHSKKVFETGNNTPGTHLAIICMDGDHMGRLLLGDAEKIGACFKDVIHPKTINDLLEKEEYEDTGWRDLIHAKRLMGPSLHAFISRALADFSHTIAPWVVESEFSGRLIYSGGDDILCIAPASEALFLTARLQQLFSAAWIIDTHYTEDPWYWRRKTWQGEVDQEKARQRFVIPKKPENGSHIRLPIQTAGLVEPHPVKDVEFIGPVRGPLFRMLGSSNSLSAGIAFSHFKTPMSALLDLAEDLLDNLAKKKLGRQAVAMSHLSRNGIKSEFGLPWKLKTEDTITAHLKMNTVTEAFKKGVLHSRLPYKLREIMPFVDVALKRNEQDEALTDEEKKNRKDKILTGFLDSVMTLPKDREHTALIEYVRYFWEEGISQHLDEPERAVEGLLLAKALSNYSGGDI